MSTAVKLIIVTVLFFGCNQNKNQEYTEGAKKSMVAITGKNILDTSLTQENYFISVKEPNNDSSMKVVSFRCSYIDQDMYLINNSYVVYESCTERKIIYADMKSFRFPINNERNFFALDKDGIYFRGEKIMMDTTGFTIIGENNDYRNPEILWKTKNAIFKNNKEITVSDVASFQAVQCFNGSYFQDKNFVYYFDKKIENSDGATLHSSCDEFTYDKNNAYLNGKIIVYKKQKVIPVNNIFLKTSKYVLTIENEKLINHPNIDVNTLRALSNSYSVDKNNAYFGTHVLPIKREKLPNVKVWEQINSAYFTDGLRVYSKNDDLKNNFDAKSFGMIPHSDFCFDKNGIYKRDWNKAKSEVIIVKFPFNYTKVVSEANTFITDDSQYIIYENQAYDPWKKKLYKNLTYQEIALAKKNKFMLNKVGNNQITIDKEYDYLLYKTGNKICWNGKETIADAVTFNSIGNTIYRDARNVYLYSRELGLQIIQGMENESLVSFNYFFIDKNYLYDGVYKIIKSKDIQILGIFTGYRKGCSLDKAPSSNYYLFRNYEGYWLVNISENVSVRNLGKILPPQREWIPNLKEPFQLE